MARDELDKSQALVMGGAGGFKDALQKRVFHYRACCRLQVFDRGRHAQLMSWKYQPLRFPKTVNCSQFSLRSMFNIFQEVLIDLPGPSRGSLDRGP